MLRGIEVLVGMGEVGVVHFLGQGADGAAVLGLDRAQQLVEGEGGFVIRHGAECRGRERRAKSGDPGQSNRPAKRGGSGLGGPRRRC